MMMRLIVVIVLASFAFAVWLRSWDVDVAYLHTGTRIWELALGGLLALVIGGLRLPAGARGVAGWLGVVLLVSCGLVLDGAQLFPGPWALWPLLAMALGTLATPDRWSGCGRDRSSLDRHLGRSH